MSERFQSRDTNQQDGMNVDYAGDIERQDINSGHYMNNSAQGQGNNQGNRVHFQDQINEQIIGYGEGEIDMRSSEQQPLDEEETDIVHDLQSAARDPVSATLIQGNVERDMGSGLESGMGAMNPFTEVGLKHQSFGKQYGGSGTRKQEFEVINAQFSNEGEMEQFSQDDQQDRTNQDVMDTADFDKFKQENVTQQQFTVNMEGSMVEVNKHIMTINRDFKENVIKKVHTVKLNDTDMLNKKIEELKQQEGKELLQLNKHYMELDLKCKKVDRKNDRYETVIGSLIDLWAKKHKQKKILKYMHEDASTEGKLDRLESYCRDFYNRGLTRRAMKAFKLYANMAGNKNYERRLKEKINIEVNAKVEEKQNQLKFLEAMVRELEEKYRIELRKKAILKSQCDQAYLRGATQVSMEALKMSNSTLADYYNGMRMPNYDGQNIFNQIRSLNGASTGFKEIIDGPVLTQQQLYVQQQQNLINEKANRDHQQM